jgi:hypothetical protein
MICRPNLTNVPGIQDKIRLTSATLSGTELPVKQILPDLLFGGDKAATEIAVDVNPVICLGPNLS